MQNLTTSVIKPTEIIALANEVEHHAHSHNQVVIGLKGRSEFNIAGCEALILPGQGCAITANSQHSFNGFAHSQLMVLNMPSATELQSDARHRMDILFADNGFFKLDNRIQQLIQLLALEIADNPENLQLTRACNNTLIALLQQHLYSHRREHQRIDMDRLDRYIMDNISNKITIAQLAGCVFLCESQFYAQFKKQMGTTPHQYILQKRFTLSKQLLENSSLSLGLISDAVGFSSQSSFTHTFTKLQGISPSKYRR